MHVMQLLQSGRTTEAIEILAHHLAYQPDDVLALALFARVMASQGRQDLAFEALQKITRLDPKSGNAYFGLAEIARSRNDFPEAEHCYQKAIELSVDDATPSYHLGLFLAGMGRHAEAKVAYEQAIERNPHFPEALINLGNLDFLAKNYEAARKRYQEALTIDEKRPEALFGLGLVAEAAKVFSEALAYFRAVVDINQNHIPSLLGIARIANLLGDKLAEGIAACQAALTAQPGNTESHNLLGTLLFKQGLDAEAAVEFRIASQSGERTAFGNLLSVLIKQGHFSEALEILGPLLKQYPNDGELLADALAINLHLCRWQEIPEHYAQWSSFPVSPEMRVHPCLLLSLPAVSRKMQLTIESSIAKRLLTRTGITPLSPNRFSTAKQGRPLRIGYLSADFHEHATAYLLAGVLEAHDESEVEVFCYSYGIDDRSAMRERIRGASNIFRDVAQDPAERVAQMIQNDHIDILVDLKGRTGGARPEILAYRPAPIQMNWLGYPGTLGDTVLADYIVGDPIVTPIDHAGDYAETLAIMPHSYQPNDVARVVGVCPTREEENLPTGAFVFCSFNQSYKINPNIFDVWCRLLEEVPGSILWLLAPDDIARENLKNEAAKRGIDPTRLVFAARKPASDHLGRLQLADLALDTFPCNSHTTCADALWAGVPLVAMIGETFASRVSASLLTAAEIPELITDSLEDYYALAYRLATQLSELDALKHKLQSARKTCELFNTAGFTLDLERLYRIVWQKHLAGDRSTIALPVRMGSQ